jgi:hypothetical protein
MPWRSVGPDARFGERPDHPHLPDGLSSASQPPLRAWLGWQRRPSGNAPIVCPRFRVVGDPREPPAQLDSSRQLSLLIEDSADRGSIGLSDNEHPNSMAVRTVAGKLGVTLPSYGMRPAKRGGIYAPCSGRYRLDRYQ